MSVFDEAEKRLSPFDIAEAQLKPKEQPYSWKDAIADTLIGGGGVLRNLPVGRGIKETISNVADPTLRGIGMGIGATVGNVALPIYGGMAGAGLGQAAGGAVADALKSQLGLKAWPETTDELSQQGKDALSGATWEGIGQVSVPIMGAVGKGIKKAYNYVTNPFTDEGSKQAALKTYETLTNYHKPIESVAEYDKAQESANNLFRKNTREAMRLGEDLGTTFTAGQASNAPDIILKERALARSVPGGANLDVIKIAEQNKAIDDYLGKQFPEGNIDDLLSNTRKYGEDLGKQVSKYQDDLTNQLSQLRTEKTPYQSGETLRNSKYALLNRRRPVVKRLFDEIPNVPVDITPIADKKAEIIKFISEHGGYRPEDIPTELLQRIDDMVKPPGEVPIQYELLKQMESPSIFQKIKEGGVASKINISKGSSIFDHFQPHEMKALIQKQPSMFTKEGGMSFDEVASGLRMDGDTLAQSFRDAISKDTAKSQAQSQIASYLASGEPTPPTVPFQRLREERNNVYSMINDYASNTKRKDRLLDLVNELKGAYEDSMNNIGLHPPEVADKYRVAANFYKKYYLPLKEGVSREMTARDVNRQYIMDSEKIPQKIFNSITDAKQFMSTLPNAEAKQAMKDYVAGNFIGNPVVYNHQTGDVNPAAYAKWFQRNKEVMKELGIDGEFDNLSKVITNLEISKNAKANFDKSIVSKLIGVDPEYAISNVFSGSSGKSPTGTMHELINRARQTQNPDAAVNGLKKAFVDYFEKVSEAKNLDVFGNLKPNPTKSREFLQKYEGALKLLFRDQPEKIQALKNVQKGYEILQRNQTTPFSGGGSPTAEHHFAIIKHRIIKSIPFIGSSYIRLQGFGQQQADAYLLRALYDPEFAYTLTNTIRNPVMFDAKVKGHLIGMGLGAIKNMSDN